ncbi:monocarboxylate transporter 14-like [Anthonomus grandis grandis]|uniref:monocarboxylate transporter 14-like n=1 Tax=Anthonomus grandis grandis TaxID=2921223 RepID=UPI0021650021|nr:monocarboxylate transporter 14-like [Anthonomus grandis grandis]XP_050298597.1 monocarboxylate transporter 14-like [Anthonomus grandis grandis]
MVVSHGHGPSRGHGGHHGPTKSISKSDGERRASHNLGKLQGRESFLTSTISIFVDENQPVIPDGGWGWLVVLASLFINLVSDGITCCFGLLYIDFLNEFGASKSATSWIGSLYVAVPLVGGPLGSALVDRYGCKKMTIVGALISTCGFILSTFAKNIVVMYITFGFLGGIGLALCYVTAVVAIAFWFDTKRTLALGLAAAGCGFGTVIYSPLITMLSLEYSWRGTVLILAGLFANMIVCGLLQRDPDWIIKQERQRLANESKGKDEALKKKLKKIEDSEVMVDKLKTEVDIKQKDRFHSVVHLPTYIQEHKEVPIEVLKNLSNDKHLYKIVLENYPNLLSSHSDTAPDKLAAEASLVNTRVPVKYSMTVASKDAPQLTHRNGSAKSNKQHHQSNGQLQHGYLANIKLKKPSVDVDKQLLNMHKYKITMSCPDDIWKEEMQLLDTKVLQVPEENKKWYHNFTESFGNIIDFTLFFELHFFLVSASTILMCIWFAVPFVYLADHMKSIGYDDVATSLTISVIGATNVLGMIIIGFLGTKMKVVTLYAGCLFLSGFCCAAMMLFSSNYYILLASSGAFGLFYACQHSLTPAVVAELVPLDRFSMAYGLSLLCQGIGKLTGPPLAGYLYDVTQSYSQSFYQAAVWIFIAGILIGIIPYTKSRKFFGS